MNIVSQQSKDGGRGKVERGRKGEMYDRRRRQERLIDFYFELYSGLMC